MIVTTDGERLTAEEAAQINIVHAAMLAQDYFDPGCEEGLCSGDESINYSVATAEDERAYQQAFRAEYERLIEFFGAAMQKIGQ